MNAHVAKRVAREVDRRLNGYNVSKEGYVLTDQEIFDRKRAERLANQPKSVLRKIYEFLI